MKNLYLYKSIDRCDPNSGAYHEDGGLVVITSGYPNDAVSWGTGNRYTVDGVEKYGLPEADLVFVVAEDTDDAVIPFPNAGCC